MTYDHERAERKKAELVEALEIALSNRAEDVPDRGQVVREIVSNFASISPPEEGRIVVQLITMNHGGLGGGESSKPGNIRFNIGRLCIAISKGVFTSVAVTKAPWLAVFGALILWDEFWACAKVELTEEVASVLYAMWMHKDAEKCIAKSDVAAKVNLERHKRSQSLLSVGQVHSSIKALERLRCIRQSTSEPSNWWLCEWVSFSYR